MKQQIPIVEREAFEKLDPESKDYRAQYDALIQKYYGLQIKALQMMGFLESEDRLNPGAAVINRAIPYYDTANISKTYTQYINAVKTKRVAENKEVAPYIEYLDIQTLPGDDYGKIFARIVKYLENY